MTKFEIQDRIILNRLRDDWLKRFIRASLKGFWSISFVLILNMFFISWYLTLRGTPVHESYFFGLYVLILPLGMVGFGKMFMEPFPTMKRYKLMIEEAKLKVKINTDKAIYFE
jgi:hypothetical protein